jgi:hypothetical protein
MDAVPPRINAKPYSANAWFAGMVLGLAGAGAAVMVYFFNPSTHGFYPICQFHRLTGLNCPGCGATRAFYALLHGQWETALRDNALFVLAVVLGGARAVWMAVNHWRERPTGAWIPGQWGWLLLVIAVVFAVLRNLPAFSFLSPI